MRRYKPTPEDEARYGLSVVEQSIWEALPEHYHAVDYALQQATSPSLAVYLGRVIWRARALWRGKFARS